MSEMTQRFFYELVTPEMATEMLTHNYAGQRSMTPDHVFELAVDMGSGNWDELLLNPIRLTADGILIDGQHRLAAVVLTNKPIHFFIDRGATLEQFEIIDSGKVRTVANRLNIPNEHNISAIARFAVCLELGASSIRMAFDNHIPTSARSFDGTSFVKKKNSVTKCTDLEVIHFAKSHLTWLRDVYAIESRIVKSLGGGTQSIVGKAIVLADMCGYHDEVRMWADHITSTPYPPSAQALAKYLWDYSNHRLVLARGDEETERDLVIASNLREDQLMKVLYCLNAFIEHKELRSITNKQGISRAYKTWEQRLSAARASGFSYLKSVEDAS